MFRLAFWMLVQGLAMAAFFSFPRVILSLESRELSIVTLGAMLGAIVLFASRLLPKDDAWVESTHTTEPLR